MKFKVKITHIGKEKVLGIFSSEKEELVAEFGAESKFELGHKFAKIIIEFYGLTGAIKLISNEAVKAEKGEQMIMGLQEVRNFLVEAHTDG